MKTLIILTFLILINLTAFAVQVTNWPQKLPVQVPRFMNPPLFSNSPCGAPSIAFDSNYIYVCQANNTWLRTSASSFTLGYVLYEGIQVTYLGVNVAYLGQ
jgi:hypothetical protein